MGLAKAVLLLLCTAAIIIPTSLVEPRYYIVPASIYLSRLRITKEQQLVLLGYYVAVDAVLLKLLIPKKGRRPVIW